MSLPTTPIQTTNPILQSLQSRKILPPPPVNLLPAVLVLCAPEIIAAGLCGAAALCTYLGQGGKPVTVRCPTLANTDRLCILLSVGVQVCTKTLQDMLDLIEEWFDAETVAAYQRFEEAGEVCRELFKKPNDPIGEERSKDPLFLECINRAGQELVKFLLDLLKKRDRLKQNAGRLWDGIGDLFGRILNIPMM